MGFFACINRYAKTVATHSNNSEINRIAEYRFKNTCRDFIAKRERVKPKYPFKGILKTVKPNFYLKGLKW